MGHREELKTELVSNLIPVVLYTAYGIRVPLFGLPYKKVGEQLPHEGILCHVWIDKQ